MGRHIGADPGGILAAALDQDAGKVLRSGLGPFGLGMA